MKWLLLLCLSGANCLAQFNFIDQAFLNSGNPNNILFKSGTVGGLDSFCNFQALQSSNAAAWFIPTASGTATAADLSLNNGNTSPTMNMSVQIWTYDSGGDIPGVPIGTASGWVSATNLTSSYELVHFSGMSAALTSGTDYCLVLYCDSEDFVNLVCWDEGAVADPGHTTTWSYNLAFTFWAQQSTDKQPVFIVYR